MLLMHKTGAIRQNSHLRVCRYHQHLADHIDINLTPLEYMIQQFPDVKDEEKTRSAIGRFGKQARIYDSIVLTRYPLDLSLVRSVGQRANDAHWQVERRTAGTRCVRLAHRQDSPSAAT